MPSDSRSSGHVLRFCLKVVRRAELEFHNDPLIHVILRTFTDHHALLNDRFSAEAV